MTASALAERVGVTPAAMSHYETKDAEPRPHVLAQLARELSMPLSYFLRPPAPADPAPYLYRSNAAATKRARESAEVRLRWFREMLDIAEAHVQIPKPDVANGDTVKRIESIRTEDIETMALEVRARWRLGTGPIPNVVTLLEAMGCGVAKFSFGAEALSSFSQDAQARPLVAINADECTAVRERFSAAHELGHLVLHRGVDRKSVWQPELHKQLEQQAHRFAAAFLFPQSSFCEEVYSLAIDALVEVKSRWRVSVQMMMRRARDLGLVNQDKYERACRDLSRRGFRMSEPLDDTIPAEAPTVLRKSIALLVDNHVMTRAELRHRMPFSTTDIEILAQLPRGYMDSDDWGDLVELRPKVNEAPQVMTGAARGAEVIPFRRRT